MSGGVLPLALRLAAPVLVALVVGGCAGSSSEGAGEAASDIVEPSGGVDDGTGQAGGQASLPPGGTDAAGTGDDDASPNGEVDTTETDDDATGPEPGEADASEPEPGEADASEPEAEGSDADPAGGDTEDGDADPAEGDTEGGSADPSTWCRPAPPELASPLASTLFDWLLEAAADGCASSSPPSPDSDGDGLVDDLDTGTPLGCDASAGCSEALGPLALTWQDPSDLWPWKPDTWRAQVEGGLYDDGRRVVALHARRETSTGLVRLEREYDPEGRLLSERELFNSSLWFERTWSWSGPLLVGATVVDSINGTGTTTWTWSYDAKGRLLSATAVRGSVTFATTWTWHPFHDAPTTVTRKREDTIWLEQSWAYDDDGRLEERSTKHVPAQGPQVLMDDHVPRGLAAWLLGDDHADALATVDGIAGCQHLPRSVVHGYPAAETVWDLGWPLGDRPGGMGFDYGYTGYAYGYGDSAWFGHGGVAGGTYDGVSGNVISTTHTYDAEGRLLLEVMSVDVVGVAAMMATRSRTWQGDLLLQDVRSWELSLAADASTTSAETALTFEYDDDGRLLVRRYLIDDVLAAVHTWSWDAEGRIVVHGIGYEPGTSGPEVGPTGPLPALPPDATGEPPSQFTHTRSYQQEGEELVVTLAKAQAPMSATIPFEVRRLTPLEGGGEKVGITIGAAVTVTERDAADRVRLLGSHPEGETTWTGLEAFSFVQAPPASSPLLNEHEHLSSWAGAFTSTWPMSCSEP